MRVRSTIRAISYHYDVTSDVLYLLLLSDMNTPAIGEENYAGLIELCDQQTDRLIGLTVVKWWKRFGKGSLPDSITQVQRLIEPLARKLAR